MTQRAIPFMPTRRINQIILVILWFSFCMILPVRAHDIQFNRIVIVPAQQGFHVELTTSLSPQTIARLTHMRRDAGAHIFQAKVDQMGARLLAGLRIDISDAPAVPHSSSATFDPYSGYLLVRAHFPNDVGATALQVSFDQAMTGGHAAMTQVDYRFHENVQRRQITGAGEVVVFNPHRVAGAMK